MYNIIIDICHDRGLAQHFHKGPDTMEPELVYDWATSHGRAPFCNIRVPPSSERLHTKMLLHLFDGIFVPIVSGHNNMRYKYHRIMFKGCEALVASFETVH